jgi:tetratricopeptide (TPR) repeat protein
MKDHIRRGCAMVVLGWLALPAFAQQPAQVQVRAPVTVKPPEALAAYFAQVRQAEQITDPEKRCLAYPDLPGNQWPAGAAEWRCLTVRPPVLALAEIEAKLATPDGAAWLEQRLEATLEANYNDPREHDRLFHVFNLFDSSERAGNIATQWLRQMPESPFALTAMGKHRAAQGWASRGDQYVSKTSAAQLKRMSQLFAGAAPLLADAMEREPRLTPACVALAEIGRQSSDALQQQALAQCLRADPASYYVVWEWMTAAMPKWGGSLQAMNKVGAYVVQHGPENPTLYSLLAEPTGYEASQMDTYAEAEEGLVAASRAGPGARMIKEAGRAYWAKDDTWMALVYLSQALRFWPGMQEVRALRGRLLHGVGDYAWALEDLLPSAAEDPEDLEVQYATGDALLSLNRIEESRPYLLRAQKLPTHESAALERYCFTYAYKYESVSTKQARDCTAALVKRYPSRGLYWMWRYQALSAARDERWVEAAGQFLLHADSDNPWQQSLKKDLLASGVQPAKSGGIKRAKP